MGQPTNCFICSIHVGSATLSVSDPGKLENQKRSQTCQLFATLACRYFGISSKIFTPEKSIKIRNDDDHINESDTFENPSNKVSACDNCLPCLQQFCDMYYWWKCIDLHLRETTKTIVSKLSDIKRSENSSSRNTNDITFENGIKDFRSKFVEKVGSQENCCWPRVKIEKLPKRKQKPPISGSTKKKKKGRKRLPCKFCGKEFAEPTNRSRHEKAVHMKIKKFECKFCGQRFAEKDKCNWHQRIHTGNKPYKCKVCGFAFAVKQNLITHERIHTGEKKHKCKFCHQRFSRLDTKNNHEKMQHIERDLPFKCAVCGELFAKKIACTNHQKSVHKMKKSQVITLALASPFKARKRKISESESSGDNDDDAHVYSDTSSGSSECPTIPLQNSEKLKTPLLNMKTDRVEVDLNQDLPGDIISLGNKNETGQTSSVNDFEAGEVFVAKCEDKRVSIINDDEEDDHHHYNVDKNCLSSGKPEGTFILPDD